MHELLQQIACLGAARRANADRGEQEAIAVGDDDVQPHVADDEVLELVAHGADQRRIDAEVGAGPERVARACSAFAVRKSIDVEIGLVPALARRQVAAAGQAADALDAMENPRFHGHGWLSVGVNRP